MPKKNTLLNPSQKHSGWVTIQEAVKIANKYKKVTISTSDIYRHALYGDILLSIYFQSPVSLRKIQISDLKMKIKPIDCTLANRLCHLDKHCFISGRNFVVSTEGEYVSHITNVIDTSLTGYEYVLVQCLLARTLKIPLPVIGSIPINYGISVTLSGETFQVFEKTTWQNRIKQQVMRLPKKIASDIEERISFGKIDICNCLGYFPIHDLPLDACFVIRHSELEKLIDLNMRNTLQSSTITRISTPLSRLFWLACKHNEMITPLIQHPYKLLSIFEQWASDDGITDRLSGDTLKNALERGSPSSASLPH